MVKDPRDAVLNITKGKRSGLAIGSRAIPHRLTKEERKLFEVAVENGMLRSLGSCRDNLANAYFLHCQAVSFPFVHYDCRGTGIVLEVALPNDFHYDVAALEELASELKLPSSVAEELKTSGNIKLAVDSVPESLKISRDAE